MLKRFFVTAIILLVIGAVIFGCVKIFGNETKTISVTEFSVGGLDEFGEFERNDRALITKEMFECRGLTVEPDIESTSTYKIFFYNMDKEFLESTSATSGVYSGEVPVAARYARVMIIPAIPEGEDAERWKIGFFEKFGIANDIEITVDKKQYVENLCVKGQSGKDYSFVPLSKKYTLVEFKGHTLSKDIDLSELEEIRVVNDTPNVIMLYLRDTTSTNGENGIRIEPGETLDLTKSQMYSCKTLNVCYKTDSNIPKVYVLK